MTARFAEALSIRPNPLELIGPEIKTSSKNLGALNCLTCEQDIFLGFFFDGTNNNKYYATDAFGHSNVARLYEVYAGKSTANVLAPNENEIKVNKLPSRRPNEQPSLRPDEPAEWPQGVEPSEKCYYRKTYIPGVGTPFEELGDKNGWTANKGGEAMALYGEERINWALLQVSNHIHQALFGSSLPSAPLTGDAKLAQKMTTPRAVKSVARTMSPIVRLATLSPVDRKKTLIERADQLRPLIAPFIQGKVQGKAKIKRVRIAVFGFSRGAAAARVFVSWLKQAYGSNIAGLELKVDFLGIFDTVASVGLAQSVPTQDGHSAWATPENLKVPADVRCVHLVAAHEVRGSFPLDAIGGGPLHKEVMYPGVHSDIGGGYEPGEQGRSAGKGAVGDAKKLSQIPLAQMYREALIAGVPLLTPAAMEKSPFRLQNFAIDTETIAIFNRYIEATRKAKIKPTGGLWLVETQPTETLAILRRRHYGQFLAWRKAMITSKDQSKRIYNLPEVKNSQYAQKVRDFNDFRDADLDLERELDALRKRETLVSPEKQQQWNSSIQFIWEQEKLEPDVIPLFEKLLHDSKAWFGLEPYRMWGYLRWRKIYNADGQLVSPANEQVDDSERKQRMEKAKQQQLENERIQHEARIKSLEEQKARVAQQSQNRQETAEFMKVNQQQRQAELLRHQQAMDHIQGKETVAD